jgi:hypothetical protein
VPATTNYYISDLVFERIHDNSAIIIDGGNNIVFERCSFLGVSTNIVTNGVPSIDTGSSLVLTRGRSYTDAYPIKNLVFNSCNFVGSSTGLKIESQSFGVTVMQSYFDKLFRGIAIGEDSGSRDSPATLLYPYAVSITDNYFDGIATQAVRGYADSSQLMSTGNLFENVGYGGYDYDEGQPPLTAILEFESSDNISSGDQFKRPVNDRLVFPLIEDNGNSCYYLEAGEGFQLGRLVQQPGTGATLTDNTIALTPITNQFSSNVDIFAPATVSYTIERNGVNRTGSMRINFQSGATVVYDDEYSEFSDVGVALSANIFSPISQIILYYTTTSTGIDANLIYDIRYHTANNAPF